MRKSIGLWCVLGTVAGCSNSDQGPSGAAIFEQRDMQAFETNETFLDETRPITSRADLPDTGSATFNGQIGVTIDDEPETQVLGDLKLITAFAPSPDPITGSADNFINDSGEAFSGVLELSNSAFGDPFGYGTGFTADIDGTLNGGETGTVSVDGSLEGAFGTPIATPGPAAGVIGNVTVDIVTDEGTFEGIGGFIAVE